MTRKLSIKQSQSIESFLVEDRVFEPCITRSKVGSINSMVEYKALCHEALQNPDEFWSRLARENIVWTKHFTHVLDESNAPFYRWFYDGELNVSANCLDKHIGTVTEKKIAIIFEADDGNVTEITYYDLFIRVCKFANALKAEGIKKNDCVIIYMPIGIESIVAMQACVRIGAIHSVVFAGFSSKALEERIIDTDAVAIITANVQLRGGRELPLKLIVDEAINNGQCKTITLVLVYERTRKHWKRVIGRDKSFLEVLEGVNSACVPISVNAEHPLFILYTSGSTGKPKGVQHASAGYLLWVILTMNWVFDLCLNDIFWCTADIGWITGHSYVTYGPLAVGATQLIFEGIPTFPHAGRFWEMIERHKVSIFYTAPTAIRSLIKEAETKEEVHPKNWNLSTLRILGTVGEPINPEAWIWYYRYIGRESCPIVDTFWQTETGGHIITPLPGITPLVPGSCTLPLPGIDALIVDEFGNELQNGIGGMLVIRRPWPAMIRTIWKDSETFKKCYFPEKLGNNFYLLGDSAVRSSDRGYFRITGRIDDVLNVSGHRLGTMEIESVLVSKTDLVVEAAVVSRPDDIRGETICAFVVLKGSLPTLEEGKVIADELRDWVSKGISPIAKPSICFCENLPKTRSGKIMRRLLRSLAKRESLMQDITTLENPMIFNALVHFF
ncbi:MAG: acetyl-CoA synthetase [Candidatus Tokpelaia sp. JSC161]|jgi:acetyl-CoA synthetase|nr:MAG: acetyl-CoA synthetase [Candidatus Tokpelaia sp. JSC161]